MQVFTHTAKCKNAFESLSNNRIIRYTTTRYVLSEAGTLLVTVTQPKRITASHNFLYSFHFVGSSFIHRFTAAVFAKPHTEFKSRMIFREAYPPDLSQI